MILIGGLIGAGLALVNVVGLVGSSGVALFLAAVLMLFIAFFSLQYGVQKFNFFGISEWNLVASAAAADGVLLLGFLKITRANLK